MRVGKNIAFGLAITVGLVVMQNVEAVRSQGAGPPSDLTRMKTEYRRPQPQPISNRALVDLGHDLFFEPRISASGKTACASCHFAELGWVVTDARSRNDSGKLTSRKSQPLIGLGYAGSAPVGWDGRSATLEAQAKASISTGSMSMRETDTPVAVEVIEERVRSAPSYAAKFNAAFPGMPINLDSIVQAVASFERTLEPALTAFDRWVDGDQGAISESAKRGFALFTGKATCSACHTGWRFTDDKFHDIGTTTTDLGRGGATKEEALNFAFKTPTLRSVALRPPYMHNASLANLDDVMKHYQKGGIDRPSRSPTMRPIELSERERRDLVAFMETL